MRLTTTVPFYLRVWALALITVLLLSTNMQKASAELVLSNSESAIVQVAPNGPGQVTITWSYYAEWNTTTPNQGNNIHIQAIVDGGGATIGPAPNGLLQLTAWVNSPVGSIPGTIVKADWQATSQQLGLTLSPGMHTATLLVVRNRFDSGGIVVSYYTTVFFV